MEEFAPGAAYQGLLARGFMGPNKTFFPPGHLPPDKVSAWERQVREAAQAEDFAPATDQLPFVGSVETVTERMIDRLKDYQIGNVAMAFQMGTMPHKTATRGMRLFAEKVMPVVRHGGSINTWTASIPIARSPEMATPRRLQPVPQRNLLAPHVGALNGAAGAVYHP